MTIQLFISDINECDSGNPCPVNYGCVDLEGSFCCICAIGDCGSSSNVILGSQLHINGCDLNPCDVNAVCFDTGDSFICTCNNGYFGDGFSCESKY